jgi:predicted TIM-barrel fold metal-dependent hydrolase
VRIDIHAHLWTDEYLDMLQAFGKEDTSAQRGKGAGLGDNEIAARFQMMQHAGIDRQILSSTPQSPHFMKRDHAVKAARFINDQYADVVRRWPDRFDAFASIPLPHIRESLDEIARALDDLGMAGVAVTTSVLGRSLTDPELAPVLAELDRRAAVLYTHPAGCGAHSPLIQQHYMTWMVGAPIEDTIAVAQLIVHGVPSRYPRLRIVNSHLGGAIPMLLQRMDNQFSWEVPGACEKPSIAARRMWYDSVSHAYGPALRAAVEALGADRILLGTDFPYEYGPLFQKAVDHIGESGLRPEDARQILDRNAAQLLCIS